MSEQHFTLNTDDKGVILIPNSILKDGEEMSEREVVDKLNEQQATIQSLKEENRKLRNIHLSIDLTYSYGYGKYLADVRVIDDE